MLPAEASKEGVRPPARVSRRAGLRGYGVTKVTKEVCENFTNVYYGTYHGASVWADATVASGRASFNRSDGNNPVQPVSAGVSAEHRLVVIDLRCGLE